jgi:hypothetical protein
MVGASTPNTIPTNWSAGVPTGLTREVVGVGTESGFPYVDIRYFGTPLATTFVGLTFETNTQIAAASGQAWAYSFYFKKIAGSIPTSAFQMTEYNSSGVFLTNSSIAVAFNTTTTLTRFSATRILTQATTAFTNAFVRIDVAALTAYDFTMRFYAPQIELGSVATDWIPTTTSAASVGIGINVPRLDYMTALGTLGTCPMLEVEEQRTNLASYSEEFNNAFWTKGNLSTISANATTSPSGTLSADKHVCANSTAAFALGWTSASVVAATAYSFSVYLKRSEVRFVQVRNNLNGTLFCNFDLELGVAGTPSAGLTASISDAGSGWYRCVITATAGASGTGVFFINMANAITDGLAPTYVGNGIDGYFAWGAQVELGSFVSTYIPTTTAAVTRLKDDVSLTGASALIGQTEGTIFLDVDFRVVTSGGIRNFFALEGSVGSQFSGIVAATSNNGNNINYAGTIYTLTQGRHKIVCTYNQTANQTKLFVDGAQRSATGTFSGFLATIDRIAVLARINPFSGFDVGRQQFGGCNQFLLFKTALSDAQCLELSTL